MMMRRRKMMTTMKMKSKGNKITCRFNGTIL